MGHRFPEFRRLGCIIGGIGPTDRIILWQNWTHFFLRLWFFFSLFPCDCSHNPDLGYRIEDMWHIVSLDTNIRSITGHATAAT